MKRRPTTTLQGTNNNSPLLPTTTSIATSESAASSSPTRQHSRSQSKSQQQQSSSWYSSARRSSLRIVAAGLFCLSILATVVVIVTTLGVRSNNNSNNKKNDGTDNASTNWDTSASAWTKGTRQRIVTQKFAAAKGRMFVPQTAAASSITTTTTTRLPFYTPTLLQNASKESWKAPLIHIVNTRFMQEQGNLTALGEARLALFRVFCLPTMQQQSTQDFLWIIKTDPDLHPTLLSLLVQLVQHLPNVYIVASNVNFRINEKFPGGWRDGAEGQDLAQSKIYTGNQTHLELAMALSQDFIVLETRLDADDGLHLGFLHTIQQTALEQLAVNNNNTPPLVQWMYWCSHSHMEWHWMDPWQKKLSQQQHPPSTTIMPESLSDMMYTNGALLGVQQKGFCITPGLTTGFAVGTREVDVPIFAHDELVAKLRSGRHVPSDTTTTTTDASIQQQGCGLATTADCLQFVNVFVFEAIRSRSPTSAGMLRIQTPLNDLYPTWWINYAFWNMLHVSFGIDREACRWMNEYLTTNLYDIAHDNLLGQCTTGHSCKVSAKADLERLMASRNMSVVSGTSSTMTTITTTTTPKEHL